MSSSKNTVENKPVNSQNESVNNSKLLPYINVAGEVYNMQTKVNQSIELLTLTKNDFFKNFGLITEKEQKNAEKLVRTYLSISSYDVEHIEWDNEEDAQKLIDLLKKRLDILTKTMRLLPANEGDKLYQNHFRNVRMNLSKLIDRLLNIKFKLDATKNNTNNTNNTNNNNATSEIDPIDDDRLIKIYLEMAWYLTHPQKVPTTVKKMWITLLNKMNKETLTIHSIVQKIANQDPKKKKTVNFFKDINVKKLREANTEDSTVSAAFSQLDLSKKNEDSFADINERIETLTMLLAMRKALEPDKNYNTVMSHSNIIKLSKPSNPSLTPMDTMSDIYKLIKPIYRYLKRMYDPVFSILEVMEKKYEKTHTEYINIVEPIIRLVQRVQHTMETSTSYGVYVLQNTPPELIEWFSSNIDIMHKKLKGMNTATDIKAFNENIENLPSIRISLDDEEKVDYSHEPYVQFFVKHEKIHNIEVEDKQSNEIKDNFNILFNNNICFGYTTKKNKGEIPMKVHLINFEDEHEENEEEKKQEKIEETKDEKTEAIDEVVHAVALAAVAITVTSPTNSPTNKSEESLLRAKSYFDNLTLELNKIAKIEKDACYNFSELTMTMFILFNKIFNESINPVTKNINASPSYISKILSTLKEFTRLFTRQ